MLPSISVGSYRACTTRFKELADIDITQEPMEVGPTTHYIMGGIRVDADSQMTAVPGLFAAGECAAGLHGANRLGGNSLSDLLVFGKRAGEYAAQFAMKNEAVPFDEAQIDEIAAHTLKPFENPADNGSGEKMGPYDIQAQLQEKMQELVGIARSQGNLHKPWRRSRTYVRMRSGFMPWAIANTTLDGIQPLISTAYLRFPKRFRLRH